MNLADVDDHVRADASADATTSSRQLPSSASYEQRTRTIAPEPEAAPRPPRRRVDVSFQGADLEHALQALADAGRFNLIVEPGIAGKVSATLRAVDAYEAMVTLAAAHGAAVRYEGNIVIVGKR